MTRAPWLAVVTVACALGAHAKPFDFVALGDTAYKLPEDLPAYDALIDRINAAKPAFSIHVGDIWGANPCTTAEYEKVRARFERFAAPVMYTPGDNEWVDCREPEVLEAYVRYLRNQATPADLALLGPLRGFDAAFTRRGYTDVVARLADLRQVFFSQARSLGKKPIPVVRQADVGDFKDIPENVSWSYGGVRFATVHVPGSQNDFYINDGNVASEAVHRHNAGIAWLQRTFAEATKENAAAVVIAMHAQLFLDGDGDDEFGLPVRGGGEGPFYWVARAIRDFGTEFGKPVLLVHGDFHELIIDKPFRVVTGETTPAKYDNITRLQVYGAPDLKAVRVHVDTNTPWVFGFTPLY
jgi:hypothetical protein